ncbi:MAG TPA: hypothetical protein VGW75_09000 [Solirubrobacteraceae bacterium]|jgi:hypothetical protein|nr:hypothetical protein [Solirubrobacteraceae bacterium]
MLEFSRALYRELAADVDPALARAARRHVLASSEECMTRLATDRRYFADPARKLFRDIRWCFPVTRQDKVHRAVLLAVEAAERHLDEQPHRAPDGMPLRCPAITRHGEPCQRAPLPETGFCPSHRHLAA